MSNKPPAGYNRPDPFILRLSLNVLKRLSFALAMVCFASAAVIGLFAVIALVAGLVGWKPLDQRLITFLGMCAFLFVMFGRYCLRMNKAHSSDPPGSSN